MLFEIAGITHRGVENPVNEDRMMLQSKVYDCGLQVSRTSHYPVDCAVCDGVGGSDDGAFAANYALQKLSEIDKNKLNTISDFQEGLSTVNNELIKYNTDNPTPGKRLTTIVGVGLREDRVIYYHSGDSRLYRFREGILRQMTLDHSRVQDAISSGLVRENYEELLRNSHGINRCLGDDSKEAEVKEISAPVLSGDLYILCSDGLWGSVTHDEFEKMLSGNDNLVDMVNTLCKTAMHNGSRDNITIVAISVSDAKSRLPVTTVSNTNKMYYVWDKKDLNGNINVSTVSDTYGRFYRCLLYPMCEMNYQLRNNIRRTLDDKKFANKLLPVLDYGEVFLDDGGFYYEIYPIDGSRSLSYQMKECKYSYSEVEHIISSVLEELMDMWDAELEHRGVLPNNIFQKEDGSFVLGMRTLTSRLEGTPNRDITDLKKLVNELAGDLSDDEKEKLLSIVDETTMNR